MCVKLTNKTIRDITTATQAEYDTDVYIGMCRSVAVSLSQRLQQQDIPAQPHEFRIGEDRVCHFAVTIPMEYYAETDSDSGRLIIDPTISQFTLENQHEHGVKVGLFTSDNAPSVGIYPPDCDERRHWYYNQNDTREGIDPLANNTHLNQ